MKSLIDVTISFGDRTVDLQAVVLYLITFEEGLSTNRAWDEVRGCQAGRQRSDQFFINEELGAAYLPLEPGQA